MNRRERTLLQILRTLEPASISGLVRATGWTRIAISGTVWRLREQRLATRSGRAAYKLTPKGRRAAALALLSESDGPRACRCCGCTAAEGCWHDELGVCEWADADLCSFCQLIAWGKLARDEVEQPADRQIFEEAAP